ncbi:MAG: DUF4192 domain-containing protein, partial [Propionibacteriaceae bacterium]
IVLTARMDIVAGHHPDELRATIRAQRLRTGASAVCAVAMCANREDAERALSQVLTECGRLVLDAVYATPKRWWSLLCVDGEFCPDEGYPWDSSGSAVAAEAVFAGMSKVATRAALADRITSRPEVELTDAFAQAIAVSSTESLGQRQSAVHEFLSQSSIAAQAVSPAECARLAVLVADPLVRDVATTFLNSENAAALVGLWSRVVEHCVPRYLGAPLGELGLAAWVSGNGALMNIVMDRLYEIAPETALLKILEDISSNLVPPSMWNELVRRCA